MPLLDHFRPPLSRTHPWRGFHGAWAAAMARLLNQGVLPAGYYAVPFLDHDGPVEIDVAALHDSISNGTIDGSAGMSDWKPDSPGISLVVDLTAIDGVRVDVMSDNGDPVLAASVELVSPGNKDRLRSRQAFASKCAVLLRQGCGVVVVDVVTTRLANLHADLLVALGVEVVSEISAGLGVVSYRTIGHDEAGQLLAWPAPLELGNRLPTVPLWLSADLAVPLDLEASHAAACVDLRIHLAAG
ncbi:hypothetical protein [Zavarzinella formosa]|uniref:hypothetical protein n=1 Tax=Zavarzinella formosa TaxID=360055 RepID=UPI00037A6924|nr:hypothetical protein [Zavarzinella formosa]